MNKRSRSLRRVRVKTPGGKTKIVYKKSKPGPARCSSCKRPIHGVPRMFNYKFRDLPKSSKKPNRPYSNLCSGCMRLVIKEKVMQ